MTCAGRAALQRWSVCVSALAALSLGAMPQAARGAAAAQVARPDALAAVRDYLDAYEPKLSELVADETFAQELRRGPGRDRRQATRTLVADFGFMRLPGDHAWLGHRSLRTIDGTVVLPEARRLERLLGPAALAERDAIAVEIANENAAHNLGHARSMNVPTLGLELLGRRHATRFAVISQRADRINGARTTRIALQERHPGGIIAYNDTSFNRVDMVAWVAVGGEVLRTDVTLFPPGRRGTYSVRVDFARSAQFAVLVPVRLEERVVSGRDRTRGSAVYSNYRRFQTSGRLVPPFE